MKLDRTPPSITSVAENVLEQIAAGLDISDSHYEAAERSYQSVGKWLNRPDSSIAAYGPTVYSQGSFRLGTVIRPPSDEDFYDLDIVCEIDRQKYETSQKDIKEAVGAELAAYATRHSMENPDSGQYCWTLLYADSAQFQIDVLPAIPDAEYQRILLEARQLDVTWVETAIAITNTNHPDYERIAGEWPTSNPRGYAAWFRERMKMIFLAKRRSLALNENRAVEKIPEYRVKTPLQSAIQILKRHRNGEFADRPNLRPASIILTTLAAHAYGQEASISGALFSILQQMDAFIEDRAGVPWIANPSDPRENFANRWQAEPELQQSFHEWLVSAREDFSTAGQLSEREAITESLAKHMGRGLMERIASDANILNALRKRSFTALARILAAPHKLLPRWPILNIASVKLSAIISRRGFRPTQMASNGPALSKHCDLQFEARTDVPRPYDVYWQIVNTGNEAREANGLRGTFEAMRTETGHLKKKESTEYCGTHSIECFIVKDGYCVAQSGPFIVNIK